jgi:hypothetical protein
MRLQAPEAIWCLFSVEQNYDQPDNNLVCWWREKPSLETLFNTIGVEMGKRDDTTVAIVKIWAGDPQDVDTTLYRLEAVSEGRKL